MDDGRVIFEKFCFGILSNILFVVWAVSSGCPKTWPLSPSMMKVVEMSCGCFRRHLGLPNIELKVQSHNLEVWLIVTDMKPSLQINPISWSHQHRPLGGDSITITVENQDFVRVPFFVFEDGRYVGDVAEQLISRPVKITLDSRWWLSGWFSWLWLVAQIWAKRPSLWIAISTGCWCVFFKDQHDILRFPPGSSRKKYHELYFYSVFLHGARISDFADDDSKQIL